MRYGRHGTVDDECVDRCCLPIESTSELNSVERSAHFWGYQLLIWSWIPRKTTIVSSLPHYVHHLTGGDPPVAQEPLGWERLGRTYSHRIWGFTRHGGRQRREILSIRSSVYGNALLRVRHQEEEEVVNRPLMCDDGSSMSYRLRLSIVTDVA